jgi:protein O-mannosyl-transferase
MLRGMAAKSRSFFIRCLSSRAFAPLFFLVLSLVLYGNSLFGEFVYDDAFFYQNGAMRDWSYLQDVWFQPSLSRMASNVHYRPLTFASFALNFLLFGESPFSFHVVSLLVHGLTSWLLFMLVRRLFGNAALAWVTAILFAVLPVHSESVAYIKARDELLVAFFGLSAWLAFLRGTGDGKRRIVWSMVAAAFSLAAFLSKESALVLPGVFVGSLLLTRGWRPVMRAWLTIGMQVMAIGGFYLLHGIAVGHMFLPQGEILYFGQNPLGYMTPNFVPWTAMQLFFLSVALSVVPWNLSATYGFAHVPLITVPWGSWMSVGGIVLLLVFLLLLVWPRSRRSPVGVGILAFLVLYFPFSKIPFYQSIDFFAERWLYAPSIGLCMAGAYAGWLVWNHWKQAAPALFMGVVVAYLFVLIPRNAVWQNETVLGESMVRDAPQSVTSYVFLGNNRLQYGRLQEAEALVGQGLAITRDHIPIHHIAAAVALGVGRLDIAEQAVQSAEALGGDELANIIIRCTLLAKQHKYQESLDHLRQSRWFDPAEHRTRMLLALNLWMLGRHAEAEQYFDWDKNLPVVKMDVNQKIRMFETY